MSWVTHFFSSTYGRKLLMAVTGISLLLFLLAHLSGNLLLFAGPEAFNAYAEFMGSNPLVRTAEIGLFALIIFHIYDGLRLAFFNNKVRGQGYATKSKKGSSWYSRNMHWTGTIILIFLILHLISFFMTARLGIDLGFGVDSSKWTDPKLPGFPAGADESLYHKVVALFEVKWYAIINILAMIPVAGHLMHGFQSAFQTMGWRHSKLTPIVRALGFGYAILVPLAFAVIPLYFMIKAF